jgi:hypothetical protein
MVELAARDAAKNEQSLKGTAAAARSILYPRSTVALASPAPVVMIAIRAKAEASVASAFACSQKTKRSGAANGPHPPG